MAVYVISYDLNKPGQSYERLFEGIKRICLSWAHPLDSTWFVIYEGSAAQLRDALRQCTDTSTALVVARLQGEAAWYGIPEECGKWLKSALEGQFV